MILFSHVVPFRPLATRLFLLVAFRIHTYIQIKQENLSLCPLSPHLSLLHFFCCMVHLDRRIDLQFTILGLSFLTMKFFALKKCSDFVIFKSLAFIQLFSFFVVLDTFHRHYHTKAVLRVSYLVTSFSRN